VKGVFIVLVALLIVICAGLQAFQSRKPLQPKNSASLPDLISQIRGSIVEVRAMFQGGGSSTGTGFIINNDGVVVTARHVIHPIGNPQEPQSISIGVRVPTIEDANGNTITGSFHGFRANVSAVDDQHDIAVITPTENPFKSHYRPIAMTSPVNEEAQLCVSVLDARHLVDGQPIFVSGYPLGMPILITTSGFIASSDPITVDRTTHHLDDIYWAGIQSNPGNSGGPVFSLTTGAVVGIMLGIVPADVQFKDGIHEAASGVMQLPGGRTIIRPIGYNSGIAEVMPTSHVLALLQQKNIKYKALERK